MIDPFKETNLVIADLLEMYEIDTNNPDVMQNVINCSVAIDNADNGFDGEGEKVGTK